MRIENIFYFVSRFLFVIFLWNHPQHFINQKIFCFGFKRCERNESRAATALLVSSIIYSFDCIRRSAFEKEMKWVDVRRWKLLRSFTRITHKWIKQRRKKKKKNPLRTIDGFDRKFSSFFICFPVSRVKWACDGIAVLLGSTASHIQIFNEVLSSRLQFFHVFVFVCRHGIVNCSTSYEHMNAGTVNPLSRRRCNKRVKCHMNYSSRKSTIPNFNRVLVIIREVELIAAASAQKNNRMSRVHAHKSKRIVAVVGCVAKAINCTDSDDDKTKSQNRFGEINDERSAFGSNSSLPFCDANERTDGRRRRHRPTNGMWKFNY